MAYIEAHQSLLTHRKTLRLARLVGLDRFAVVGRLLALWCWALDNAPEGVISKADSDILADVMGWPAVSAGRPSDVQNSDTQLLCDALVTSGFLDDHGDSYLIHDWFDYAGRLIEKRKVDAERKRRERSNSGQASGAHSVQRTSSGHPRDGAGTVPYPTVSISIPRESNTSEISFAADAAGADGAEPDSVRTPHGESGSGAQAQTGESAAAPPASCSKPSAALVRRVVRAAGATLPAKQVERLIGQHGELSEDRLIFEVGLAAEWIADPSRNKDKGARKRQMTVAFLHNWLKRAEDPRPPVTLVTANGARAAPNEPKPLPDVRGMSLKARPAEVPMPAVTVEAS